MTASIDAVGDPRSKLHDARVRETLRGYVSGLIARREYIWYVSISDLRARHMNSVLGNLWHLLNPILQISVYYLIFGLGIRSDRGVDNFMSFLVVGVIVYMFTQRSTMAASRSLPRNRGLIRLISFPRALLPITSTLTEVLAALSTFAVVVAVVLFVGDPITLRWLVVIPILAGQALFNLGAAFIAARASHQFADIQQLLPFVFRLGFYASGVIFNVEAYITSHGFRTLFRLNPMYCYIEMYRWAFIRTEIDPALVLSAAIWTVAILVLGFVWFRAGEDRYGRV